MSRQDAEKFITKLENDAAFREKLKNAKDPNDRKKIVQETNLNFTKQEIEQVVDSRYKEPLTQEQMKKIAAAGGKPMSKTEYMGYAISSFL